MSPEIHANDIREIADASSPEIDEKARKELLEMAGTWWKPGGQNYARKKSVGATRGGGSEQSKVTCDLCDISAGTIVAAHHFYRGKNVFISEIPTSWCEGVY
ncbi:hypothetical protein C8F04DRAFT_1194462 [Mycena alexandri]|uniref:Uncharacterized protein n=1 Tax=Mycena alexandri TaxID=1745969 RepID=A0AAD6WVC6_9AGAR|nr:hypothetical protein C8F04DRAFT_1194462 [Mycena alexandri]